MALFTDEEKNAFMTILMNKLGDVATTLVTAAAQKMEQEVVAFIGQLHPETFVPKFFAEIHALAQGYLLGRQHQSDPSKVDQQKPATT